VIFTFYSYKGGVGRSMAMAGVAYLLARRGLKVLTIDFDLEAPGLERYFFESEPAARVREHPGLMDLIQTYKLALTSEAEFEAASFKSWWSFVYEAIPSVPGGGRVDLMTAGRREPPSALRDYAYAVRSFDWQDFFDNWKGERFFDWLRRQLTESERAYDVVLVDSRTGVTEMGGICAYQLADVAIMLCAPNLQNIDGTLAVANDFRSDAVIALRRGRPLEILVIPARLEENNPRCEDFFHEFERKIGSEFLPAALAAAGLDHRSLALPYDPQIAVIERLVGEEGTTARAEQVFQRLAHALTLLATRDGKLRDLQAKALAELRGQASEIVGQVADPTRTSAGYDVFIDYLGTNRTAVGELARRLENDGLRVWYDVQRLDAGANWGQSVDRALEESQWLLLLLGSGDAGQDLRRTLIRNARRRGRPRILPVILDDPSAWDRLAGYTLDDFQAIQLGPLPGTDSGYRELVAVLLSKGWNPVAPPSGSEDPSAIPYPGGRPFREDESAFFFGRNHETDELLDALDRYDVVLLAGPAGVGKTSLLMAGVAPRVRQSPDPAAVATWSVEHIDLATPGAADRLAQLGSRADTTRRLCVLDSLDSFPEPGSYDARAGRFARVAEALRCAGERQKFVLIWRGTLDESERHDVLKGWGDSAIGLVALHPLGYEALSAAVSKPAERLGHLCEPGLVERLIDSAGTGGSGQAAVAQIQRLLPSLWAERRRGWLTNKAIEQAGGVAGALHRALRELRAALDPAETATLRALVCHLVDLDPSLRLTTRSCAWRDVRTLPALAPDPVALRDRLAERHLLELWRMDPVQNDPGGAWCALAIGKTDAYDSDGRLADAEFLLPRRRLAALVANWDQSTHDEDALLTGGALSEAENFCARYGDQLTGKERQFIAASLTLREDRAAQARQRESERFETEQIRVAKEEAERERDRAEANRRRLRWALMAAVFSLALMTWFYNRSSQHLAEVRLTSVISLVRGYADSDPTASAVALAEVLAAPKAPQVASQARLDLARRHMSYATLQHGDGISHFAFSPDGQAIATASRDGTARLWRRDGTPLVNYVGHRAPVTHVAFSPNGRTIATASADGTARVWMLDGTLVSELGGHSCPADPAAPAPHVLYVTFSPDDELVGTVARDGTMRLWQPNGTLQADLTDLTHCEDFAPGMDVPLLAFSSDGLSVATYAVKDVRLWQRKGSRFTVIPLGHVVAHHLAFSPDGQALAIATEGATLDLWNREGALLTKLVGHSKWIAHVAFSSDGKMLATASGDGTARVWAPGGNSLAVLGEKGGRPIDRVAFSNDNTLLMTFSQGDDSPRVWSVRDGTLLAELKGHSGYITDVAFSSDAQTSATASKDGTVRLWQRYGTHLAKRLRGGGNIDRVVFSPDGLVLATGSAMVLQIWKPDGTKLVTIDEHLDSFEDPVFSPDGKSLAVSSKDGATRVWQHDGSLVAKFQDPRGPIRPIAFSPCGRSLATTSRGALAQLWPLNGKPPTELKGNGSVSEVVFSKDGETLASVNFDDWTPLDGLDAKPKEGQDGPKLWRRDGKLLAEFKGHDDAHSVALSPDGLTVATASANTVRLWQSDGTRLAELKGKRWGKNSLVVFSPDSQLVATVLDARSVGLWKRDGTFLVELEASNVGHIAFGPDSRTLATISAHPGNRVMLFTTDGTLLAAFMGNTGTMDWRSKLLPKHAFSFSGDGHWFATASANGEVWIWPLSSAAFIERVRAVAEPCLRPNQRRLFFLEDAETAEQKSSACLVATGRATAKTKPAD
jgi:WD40 repeat protein